ncbi:MAG TPA: gliding motility-associated C-terminal domain-containing protein [Ferruginibacter sp.]|nr:gliding motility-associated C-terminal domain-containing protein [Ferruginibacter sp.]HMP22384.1 gliding motility-associated C-terminal domain-containing protein [Ferruginibacter sp.]
MVLLLATAYTASAANYFNVTGAVNANLTASWTTDPGGGAGTAPANFTSGDVFTIRAATTMNTNAAWTVSGTGAGIVITGTLTLSNPLTINGSFTNNGTFNHGNQLVTIGTGGDIAGTGTITFFNLTISTDNPADIVTLSKTLITIRGGNNAANGRLTLNQGVFKIGAGNTINFDNNSSENSINNPNATGTSNFATTGTNGEDGGRIVVLNGSGAALTFLGNGQTTVYDFSIGTAQGQGNRTIRQTNPNVQINGTLSIFDNQCKWQTNSPVYGAASTLIRNNNGQQYSPGGGDTREWMPLASGTIGVTPGYPNNVTIMNVGSSASNYGSGNQTYGVRLSGSWSINGTLQVGTATTAGFVDLGPGTNFTCGGIIIENNSRLRAPDAAGGFVVRGNWLRTGNTVGAFTASTGTVQFSGNGTAAAPQTVTASDGSETIFNNVSINSGTYVKLNSPVGLNNTGVLNLVSGIIETSSSALLTINNTATAAVTGGSGLNYINGPLRWSLGATGTYNFPTGKGEAYLPFSVSPASASAVTIEAFNSDCGGTPDNVTVNDISRTEYWSLTASPAFASVGTLVSAGRANAINAPFNALAKSSTPNGVYTAVGGTVSGNMINNAGGIGIATPVYFVIAEAPLAITGVAITAPTCVPGSTGTITVTASGGTPPYQYKIDNGAFSSSNIFTGLAEGEYSITVQDAANTTKDTLVTVSAIILTKDTTICSSAPVNLTATGVGANYTWTANTAPAVAGLSATTGNNVTATPTATTTYTVTAEIYDPSGNRIVNGGFEAGNTDFTSGFIFHLCAPYASSWNPPPPPPCNNYGQFHNGIYLVTGNPQNLCTNLTSFTPRTGNNMMVIDGPNSNVYTQSPYPVWSQTVNGLTPGVTYIFSYWVRNAFPVIDGNSAILRAKINGVDLTANSGSGNPHTASALSWVQVTYQWQATGTSAAIELFDERVSDVSNDFALDDIEFIGPCQVTKSVTITVGGTTINPPAVTNVTYCVGEAPVSLAVSATGTNLLWYTAASGGQGSGTAPTPSTAVPGSTTYYVSQTVQGSCGGESSRAAITVTVNAAATVPVVTNPPAYCQNQNAASLAASVTGTNLLWYTAASGGQGSATAPTPSTATPGTTTYYVTQTTACGESERAVVTVVVNAGTTVPAVTNPGTYCQNENAVSLAANATGTSLLWYTTAAGGQGSAIAPTPSTANAGTTQYYVSQGGTCGESERAVITVTVNASTTPPAVTNPAAYCQNQNAASLAANATGTNLLWYTTATGGQGSAAAPTPSTAAAGTTQYYVSQGGTCGESSRAAITVMVNAVPSVNAGDDKIIAPGSSTTLNASASQGTYSWSPSAGLSATSVLNPVASPAQTVTYTLTVNSNGCTASDDVLVTVQGDCLDIAKAFTPNNDGFNDVWIVTRCPVNVKVDVYNRWGGLIFHADNYDNKWNGTRNGSPVPDGTYYYVIRVPNNSGGMRTVTGNVTIMR